MVASSSNNNNNSTNGGAGSEGEPRCTCMTSEQYARLRHSDTGGRLRGKKEREWEVVLLEMQIPL